MNILNLKEFVELYTRENCNYVGYNVHVSKIKDFHKLLPPGLSNNQFSTVVLFKNKINMNGNSLVLSFVTLETTRQFYRRYSLAKCEWLERLQQEKRPPFSHRIYNEITRVTAKKPEMVKDKIQDFYYQKYLKSKETIG